MTTKKLPEILDIIYSFEKKMGQSLEENPSFKTSIDYLLLLYYLSYYEQDEQQSNYYFQKGRSQFIQLFKHLSFQSTPLGVWYGHSMLGYLSLVYFEEDEQRKFKDQLNSFIKVQCEKMIHSYDWKDNGMFSGFYDMISGISGIGVYFINQKNLDREFIQMLTQWVIQIIQPEIGIQGYFLEGFYIPKDKITNPQFKMKYTNGYIDMGLSHGVAGCLYFLVKAKELKIEESLLSESIFLLIQYYKKLLKKNQLGFLESPTVLKKNDENQFEPQYFPRLSWCYGLLGILRVLYLTKESNDDSELQYLIENELNKISLGNASDFSLECPTFCHGYSGLLYILHLFQTENNQIDLHYKIDELEQIIWESASNDYPFYFRKIDRNPETNEEFVQLDNLSAIDGVTSIIIPYLIMNACREIKKDIFSEALFLV
ncbi:lanthionine synthetase LanC family protein [Carnobacterium maltaromaticum]|uniref:lanthionine synthetase LanC family protein n=1 Tax=Carnobacterium maltaromaticum TaxID=2751 RepID=UPI00295E465E|nr:lanthionine synthetase LanC family protein [Carnobacterium maltaromaticum]